MAAWYRRLGGDGLLPSLLALTAAGCGEGGDAGSQPIREVTTPSGVKMVLLSGGHFTMGTDAGGPGGVGLSVAAIGIGESSEPRETLDPCSTLSGVSATENFEMT